MLRRCVKLMLFQRCSLAPTGVVHYNSTSISDSHFELEILKRNRKNESLDQRKARLLYQSRKRGMLENGLLLSTFANKYLNTLSPELTEQYDRLINEPSNDWDIYYWITGKEKPPPEFNNEIFQMLKKHTENKLHEKRYRQPDIEI